MTKNKTFLIATVLFILFVGALYYFFFPRLWQNYQDQAGQLQDLNTQIASQTQYINTIKSMSTHADTINSLYNQASGLLPADPQTDLLSLQLDGLLSSVGLTNLNVTVPFASKTSPLITLTGNATFQQAESLIARLKTLGRWNKISLIDITNSANVSTVAINTNVFFKSTKPADFTGSNTNLLSQASSLFNQFQNYATLPNAAQEGQFGRTDPFATPK